ncbi:molybdopterin oxidoreductase family protein [Roseomonas sp. NAR14]|uniref:Molybdopterin oxidoreductase family protein n=1 Tax=Roseomonas acroporae TaxID=2937791 RepID=A0A9X1Y4U7_9PROT|nr:molybdopterin oxidoreductase family protein [Roseomonas acroporae]MCK8783969.1 molybdopterin oxidoreductase family protein [Roseomonas acroporae]
MTGALALPEAALGSHCPYCALQCAMRLVPDEQDPTRLAASARDFPSNRGGMCRKGWTAAEPLQSPDRLTTPLLRDRKGATLRPASWDEALDRVVAGLRDAQAKGGPDAAAIFGGGGLTNEKAYLLGKFARIGLGTRNIDYNGRFCMASAAAAGTRALGLDRGFPFPLSDLPEADAILIVGGNPAETMPPIMQYFDALKAKGGRLIVSDPRRTATAEAATLHLQPTPGTDAALANGLLHVAVRDRLIDEGYIAARTEGFEAVRRLVASWWPDRTERVTGVPARLIEQAAHMLGEAPNAYVLTGRGPEQQSHGVDNVLAFINLALALGKVGKLHSGWGTFTGQGNGQGGREHGQKADQLPGYRMLANPEHRRHVAAVWGVDPDSLPPPGPSAMELLAQCGAEGGIRALIVLGANLLVSAPAVGQLRERLESLDLLVVGDPFLSETAAIADVVLPVAQWAEEEGTMTNLEGRIILRRRMVQPAPGVRTDAEIVKALADRLGHGDRFTAEPRAIFEELRRASAGGLADYSGVTWERIAAEDGVFWPCPEGEAGTPRPFLDRFPTASGRAKFHRVDHRVTAEEPDSDYPLFLTTGRVMAQYQSGTQTRRVAALNEAEPAAFCEIHAEMARTLGIREGEPVRLTSRRGTALVRARFSRSIRMDTVFVPFHWGGEACANLLTSTYLDPVSRIPEFKVCAVRVEPAGAMPATADAAMLPAGTAPA